jgi:hypothetical protein
MPSSHVDEGGKTATERTTCNPLTAANFLSKAEKFNLASRQVDAATCTQFR